MTHPARFFRALAVLAIAPVCSAFWSSHAAHATDLSSTDLASKLAWRSVGPYIGGRVVAIDGVASRPDLFYMGTVDGGVWKSTNYGITWKNLSDGWPSQSDSIGALAVAPSDPKIIYAGTGESDIRGDMITGDGVYKSTDAGKTWTYAGLRDTHTTMDLIVDPHNPDIVYAASMGHVFVSGPNRGVFKSTDGGKNWRKVLFVDDKTGVVDLAMDPNNSSVIYAAAWQAYRKPWQLSSGGPGSGVYKSTDGGEHWTNITKHKGFPAGVIGKIGLGIAASNPDIVYAAVQAKDGGLFRSDDGGASWKRVNDNWELRQRAFYYTAVFVDPKDPDTVYMPEVSALFVSHDAGKTFTKLHTPHGDNHIVWINPDNTNILLEGNDGGATVSTDRGKTWSSEHNQPTGQFYHVNLDDQFPFHIYGAQQDEGSFEGPSASSQHVIPLSEWHRVAYGESTFVVPQPGDADVTYGSGYYSIFLRYDMRTEQFNSVSPWPRYREGASAGELKYRMAWTHPILFSPTDPKQLIVGAQYVMKSDDYGRTWRTISPDLTRNDKSTEAPSGGPVDLDQSGAELYPNISALAVSPLDGSVIWAGSSDGLVHVTTDDGGHWKAVTPRLPKWTEISSIEPSHVDKGTAYLTASRYMWDDFTPYVFKTTDYGRTWTAITHGLPDDQYVLAVRQDPNDADLLFLGTKNTVFASFDGGSNWQPLKLNLPHVQVRDLAINARQGALVAATHGRAFWVLDDIAALEQLTKKPSVDADSAFVFAPERAWLTKAYGKPEAAWRAKGAGRNPPFGASVYFHIPKNYDGKTPVSIAFADPSGTIIRSFDLHLKEKSAKKDDEEDNRILTPAEAKAKGLRKLTAIEPGMNRFQWNLRYPDAAEVKGFYVPIAAGGMTDEVSGPIVVPGTYRVILDYGGEKTEQPFQVALDPRIKSDAGDLDARFALQMQIHKTLDGLDQTINRAIDARDRLQAENGAQRKSRTAKTIAALDADIGDLVQLDVQSGEGTLLHETKLRSHLSYLAADLDLAYVKPTPAQYAVFKELQQEASAGEKKIESTLSSIR